MMSQIPHSLIAGLARFSVAAIFWKSGQTKIEGLSIDLLEGQVHLGWPHLSDSALDLFKTEYKLPLLSPNLAAHLSAFGEHLFPILLLLGVATRFSALGLLTMTLVIEIFVYPDAYPTHGVWATALLYIIAKGPGRVSVDYWIAKHYGVAPTTTSL